MAYECGIYLAGVLAFIFFSGDAEGIISVSSITDYMNNYKPELNFYLVPVIVSRHSCRILAVPSVVAMIPFVMLAFLSSLSTLSCCKTYESD